MMAQHILTRPVFDALFQNYDFSSGNPVAIGLNSLQKDFAEFGLESETRDLKGFYESVQKRASGIKRTEGKQTVLMDLYEQFFKKALKKEADRLGIAYTPIELVDFILHSVNDILESEFGKSLSDKDVHILDPFTGTGTFLVQLLKSGLIKPEDLERKYHHELHANEILLLAYYIASVNIEETYRGQRGGDSDYEPFEGIILTDTFNLNKHKDEEERQIPLLPEEQQRMAENNKRVERQKDLPIEVIIGNPPWSAGQKNAADDNPNVPYPELEKRITDTYAEYSVVTNKRYLYDSYKMAIRWATDRLKDKKQGVIAFVTPATWIDGNSEAGIRACLPEEFDAIYVLNLLGNARIHDKEGRYHQGEGVFGNATQSPVAITLLVKNLSKSSDKEGQDNETFASIYYRDIGSNLKRQGKLQKLTETVSISGFTDWQTITPNQHYDWIEQRSDIFTKFYPLGTKEAKAGKTDNAIFTLYSLGLATGRDPSIYNFSHKTCAEHAQLMTQDYINAFTELEQNPELTVEEVVVHHTSNVKWNRELLNNLKRKKKTEFSEDYIRKAAYRPFIGTNCYADYTFSQMKYQVEQIFPDASSENKVICTPGISTKKSLSVLMTDTITDLNLNDAGTQCFPRWRYPKQTDASQMNVNNIEGGGTFALTPIFF